MPENKVKMLASVEANNGSGSMGVNLGSNMSQWARISFRAVVLTYSGGGSFTDMGVSITGSTHNDIYNIFNEGNTSFQYENIYSAGTNYFQGMTMHKDSTANHGIGRVIEIDFNNPGVYGKDGTNNQRWMANIWSQQVQVIYSNNNRGGAQASYAYWRVLGDPSQLILYAASGTSFAAGSRMDVYAWGNGT